MRVTGIMVGLVGVSLALGSATAQPPPMTKVATPPSISEVDGRSIKDWMGDLTKGDAGIREEAIRALVLFTGPHSSDLVDALILRTGDPDSSVRVRACMALTVIEVEKSQIPKIVRAMGKRLNLDIESQSIVRFHSAVCLYRFGEDAKDVIPDLAVGSRDPSSYETRRLCLRILETAGQVKKDPPDPRAIEAMIQAASRDATATVRLEAVIGLGSIGRSPLPALNAQVDAALNARLRDAEHAVCIWANVSQMALDKVTEQGIKNLVSYLKNPNTERRSRREAIRALGLLGDRAKSAIPALMDQLHDKDSTIVIAACGALGYMGGDGKPAVPMLIEKLKDKQPTIIMSACGALALIGSEAKAAVGPLKALAEEPEQHAALVNAAEEAIKLINGEKPAVKAP